MTPPPQRSPAGPPRVIDLRPAATPGQPWRPIWMRDLAPVADREDADLDVSLDLAAQWGRWAPTPGSGRTGELWSMLATLASFDLTAARAVEPHLDALAIIAQSPQAVDLRRIGAGPTSRWGVFAAEGPGRPVEARPYGPAWRLDGEKPWCSLADRLSHAVLTARTEDGGRRAYALSLRDEGVEVVDAPWVSRGLSLVRSGPIRLDRASAVAVGEEGWYLHRPGFAWGGIGVAACWLGGAVGVARTFRAVTLEREPDQVALMHLGAVDTALFAAATALRHAAHVVDDGAAAGTEGSVLASRVRDVVARTVDEVVMRVGHATGPAPLTAEERHARRVADLQVYIRQHHAERDQARLGREVVDADGHGWW